MADGSITLDTALDDGLEKALIQLNKTVEQSTQKMQKMVDVLIDKFGGIQTAADELHINPDMSGVEEASGKVEELDGKVQGLSGSMTDQGTASETAATGLGTYAEGVDTVTQSLTDNTTQADLAKQALDGENTSIQNVGTSATEAAPMLDEMRQSTENATTAAQNLDAAQQNVAASGDNAKIGLDNAREGAVGFGDVLPGVQDIAAGFAGGVAGFFTGVISGAIQTAINKLLEFSQASIEAYNDHGMTMAQMRIALGLTEEEAQEADASIQKIFDTGVVGDRRELVVGAYTDIARSLGLVGEDAENAVVDVLTLSEAFGTSYSPIVEAAGKIMQTWGVDAETAIAGVYDWMLKNTDSTTTSTQAVQDLNDMVEKWGGTAEESGATMGQFLDVASDKTRDLEKTSDHTWTIFSKGADTTEEKVGHLTEAININADAAEKFGQKQEAAAENAKLAWGRLLDKIKETIQAQLESGELARAVSNGAMGAYYTGTVSAERGVAAVAEKGPELITKGGRAMLATYPQMMNLSGGERIYNANATQALAQRAMAGGQPNVTIQKVEVTIDAKSVKTFQDVVSVFLNREKVVRSGHGKR